MAKKQFKLRGACTSRHLIEHNRKERLEQIRKAVEVGENTSSLLKLTFLPMYGNEDIEQTELFNTLAKALRQTTKI